VAVDTVIPLGTRLYDLLTADVNIAALVVLRVYPTVAPQGTPYPYIVWQEVSSAAETTHDGDSVTDGGLDQTLIQFDCWGDTSKKACALRALVRKALLVPGALTGTKVNRPDQRLFHEAGIEKHNAQLDLLFWHNPTQ